MNVIAINAAVRRPAGRWPTPLPLPSALPDVPAFVPSMLPADLQPWAVDIADRMQVPLDFVAMPAMVCAGALLGSRIGVCAERNTNWAEVANLWGCIVGPPGSLKSPAMSEVLAPIRRLEAQAAIENEAVLAEHGRRALLAKLHREAAEAEAKKLLRAGDVLSAELALADIDDPEPPKLKRYMTIDATVEKLGEICAANPAGILVHRDEVLTLFADLDREEKVASRGFYLQGWKGTRHIHSTELAGEPSGSTL